MQSDIKLSLLSNISDLTKEIYRHSQTVEQKTDISPIHRNICNIWQQILEYDDFDLDDDLFKVGGDSIAVIQILSAVNNEFGINIPMDELFSSDHFSISWLAELVEKYQVNLIGEDEYSALLAKIENLSEEEVNKLLSAEA